MTQGFHNLTSAEYHADPCPEPSLSSSIAKMLVSQSPAHAFAAHPKLGGGMAEDGTAEMEFGELAHRLILGKGAEVAILESDSWRGKEAAAFWDAARLAQQIPCLRKTHTRAETMAAQVKRQLLDMNIDAFEGPNEHAQSEVVAIWQEGKTWCRAMIDRMIIREKEGFIDLYDFKTMSQSAHPKACASRIASMRYDIQRAHYIQGVQKLRPDMAGRIRWTFIFAETTAPFGVTPLQIDGEWSAVGLSAWLRSLELWQTCLASGKWPSYTDKIVIAEAPPWALAQEIGA